MDSRPTTAAAAAARLPLSDETVHHLALLTEGCTEADVRAAIAANPLVRQFFAAPPPTTAAAAAAPAASNGTEATATATINNSAQGPGDVVALCELKDEATGRSELVATTEPAAFFQRLSGPGPVKSGADGRPKLPVSCTLVGRRYRQQQNTNTPNNTAADATIRSVKQLGVRDLFFQSVDLARPLDALQQWLQGVYEPMLRARRHQLSLRTSVQDLLTGIRSANSALPEVDLLRFVPEDLLELCRANPGLEVAQLADRLGEQARDPSYLRRVLQVRNRCNAVLPLEELLSGKKETDQLHQQQQHQQQNELGVGGGDVVAARPHNAAAVSGRVVQEKIAYWESAAYWVEDVARQLESREWRLTHRLLGHRVETSYAPEYVTYAQRIREYVKYLQAIPERQLTTIGSTQSSAATTTATGAPDSCQRFVKVCDDILAAVARPSSYPVRLVLPLLESLGDELAAVWVRSVAEGGSGGGRPIADSAAQARRRGDDGPVSPQAALRSLREVELALQCTQTAYGECVAAVLNNSTATTGGSGGGATSSAPSVRSSVAGTTAAAAAAAAAKAAKVTGSRHPGMAALLARAATIREWLERHFLLVAQLSSVFATKVRAPSGQHHDQNVGRINGSPTTPASAAAAAAAFSPITAAAAAGEGYVADIERAYDACADALCVDDDLLLLGSSNSSGGGLPLSQQGRSPPPPPPQSQAAAAAASTPDLLWSVTPTAQRRVREVLEAYQSHVRRCDEQVARTVSHLLSTEQSVGLGSTTTATTSSSSSSGGGGGHVSGLRMFRVFANFRFLQLEKVQRVVKGYEAPIAERILAEVKYLQDEYFSVTAAKRATRFASARNHLSPAMGQIARDAALADSIRQCIVRHDYVTENGWHQLLSLRNVEHVWRLDARLAEFIGYPLEDLVTPQLHAGSIVHGSAYGLAYLALLYADDEADWSADANLSVAQALVQRQHQHQHSASSPSTSVLQAAKDRLLAIGAGTVARGRRKELREIRNTHNTVVKRLEEKVTAWCEEGRRRVTALAAPAPAPLTVRGCVFRPAEARDGGPSAAGSGAASGARSPMGPSSPSAGQLNSRMSIATGTASVSRGAGAGGGDASVVSGGRSPRQRQYRIEVAFPWDLFTMAEDLRFLEGTGLPPPQAHNTISNNSSSVSSDASTAIALTRDFLRSNEHRGRLAECLAELVSAYYSTVDGEDDTLVLLATDAYGHVNELLMRGFSAVRWSDEAGLNQFAQGLADRVLAFTRTVRQVRQNTEAAYSKIRAFHVRAFHPEAIVQRVKEIRSVVGNLSLHSANTHLWVRRTQPLLDAALRQQMQFLLHGWTQDFLTMRTDVRFLERGAETDVFRLKPLRVRMRVVFKEVRLETPAAAWRSHWIDELNKYLQWLDLLPRLYNEEDVRRTATTTTGGVNLLTMGLDDRSMSLVSNAGSRSGSPSIFHSRSGGGGGQQQQQLSAGVQSFIDCATTMGTNTAIGGTSSLTGAATTTSNSNTTGAATTATASGGSLASPGSGGRGGSGGGNGDAGYQYLLERLPAAALAAPLAAIEQCITDASAEEKEWRQSQEFLNLDVGVLQQRFGADLRRWSDAMQLMQRVTTQLMDYTQPNKLLGGIVIVAEDAQLELGRKIDQVSQYTHGKFKDVLEKELEATYDKIKEDKNRAEGLDVINDMSDAAAFLSEVPRIKKGMEGFESGVALMVAAEESLQKLGYIFPDHWTYAARVRAEHNSLKDLMERRLKALEFRRPFLIASAETALADLEAKCARIAEQLAGLDERLARQTPAAAQAVIDDLHDQAVALQAEGARVAAIQESLGAQPVNLANVARVLADCSHMKEVWGHITKAFATLNRLGGTPFFEMVPRTLQEDLERVSEDIDAYPKAVRGYPLCEELREKLAIVLGYRRLMQDLRSDAMSPLDRAHRHWAALKAQLCAPWVLEALTVQNVWDSNPSAHAPVYSAVIEAAQGERRIEVQLGQISAFWEAFQFGLIVYKKQVGLVKGWDAVFERLQDDLATFSGIRASPFFNAPQLVAMTNESEARLNRLRQVLEVLLEVQKRWVYLDGVFSDNAEIRAQLPHDTVQFDRTSRELMHVFPRPLASGTLSIVTAQFFLEDEKLLATLERLYGQLTAVQRALTTYLDTQRGHFPRFFFVGDDDLLEILGNSKDPTFISKHLRKMFTALASFTLDKPGNVAGSNTLRGFASLEGEEVKYKQPVEFRQRPMHEWLREAEEGMAVSLRESTLHAFAQLTDKGAGVTLDWLDRFPSQMVCLAVQMWWVQLQESLFTSDEIITGEEASGGGKTTAAAMPVSKATEAMDKLLASLASSVLGVSLSPSLRHKCEQVITIAVYQRDMSRMLAARGVTSARDFDWLSVLRLYATTAPVTTTTASGKPLTLMQPVVECRMADAALVHGFEYTGAYERLVQTPLTDKCYLTLMQAIHTRLGGSPVGPAGTGKTETVKALGLQLGRHVLVFNCDEAFDYQAVSRIFLGLCQVGAWGCFDEFNRLEERIMSALSQQIQIIQETLRARSPEVDLNNHRVPLHDNVGIFITMNPGYAGRSNLPGNLKQLFRQVTMTIPDRETIAEVMLFAQGFHTAERLSHKIVPLFRLCEEQLSRQAHYDFGLRALKSVLVAAGALMRRSKGDAAAAAAAAAVAAGADGSGRRRATTVTITTTTTKSDVVIEDEECAIMLESIIANIAPKLVTQDVALFYPLLSDFFPNHDLPRVPMRELREAIALVCESNGLSPAAEWVEKICQLHHTKETRHGIMIVGPSGTGKTTAWKTLMAAMVRVDRALEMQAYVIDPKVLSKAELFGSLDITTREWKDGVFTSILRKILEAEQGLREREEQARLDAKLEGDRIMAPNSRATAEASAGTDPLAVTMSGGGEPTRREYWVIFDGDVDPEWVENLNSVLDDNKILTLPNGERLPLPSSMRVMFEAQNLRYATPATVSRCGMLWFSEGVVAFSSVLSYARHQLSRKPICDVRGRRVRWSLQEDMVGLTPGAGAATMFDNSVSHQQHQSLSPLPYLPPNATTTVSGHRGKVYSQYVISSSTTSDAAAATGTFNIINDDITDSSFGRGTGSAKLPGFGRASTSFVTTTTAAATTSAGVAAALARKETHPDAYRIKEVMLPVWSPAFLPDGLIIKGIGLMVNSSKYSGATIMEFNMLEVLESILAMLIDGVWKVFQAQQASGATLPDAVLTLVAEKTLEYAVYWGLGAAMNYERRRSLESDLGLSPSVSGVGGGVKSMTEVEVNSMTGEWRLVRDRVRQMDILAEQVGANDTVIPTVDTCRHEDLLQAWLGAGRSAILCGPPGSGKTMSITAVLNSSPQYEAVFLNFSSGTSVDTVIKALEQYCTVTNTAHGFVMAPASGKKLLLFCDEINLPALNQYGTQVVLQLLRQLVERGGFYRPRDNVWVEISNIQIVGACNPPTDPGRVPLSARFLRWAPVLLVDFPSPESLHIIYTTYCRAILGFHKKLHAECATPLAEAMVAMYRASQRNFSPLQHPHYLYSPRELSRWSRAVYEGFSTWEEADRRGMTAPTLCRLAIHEGLRVFSDRLVTQDERDWTDMTIDDCFKASFPTLPATVYTRPMLYSTLLSRRGYTDSPREGLRALLQRKLPAFCEEEVSVPLVTFDAVIDHVVRIDRVLRQPLGHVLIAGSSGVGKTIIARFVAWLGGFSPFWLKVHRDYQLEDFEEDLRGLLRRSGCRRERICFLFDESNILQPSFLEYMNALLASGEVPGLFEGEEWPKLMQDIRDAISATQSAHHLSQQHHHQQQQGGGSGGGAGGGGRKRSIPGGANSSPIKAGGSPGKGKAGDGSPTAGDASTGGGGGGPAVGIGSAAADAIYVDTTNEQSLYRWFLNNIKEQLHVVFTINPINSEFSNRAVASPALFNRCTVDWFGDWDHDTLVQIASERLKDVALLSSCGNVFRSEEDARRAVVETICEIHQSTQEVNTALRARNANQGTHVTPRHFSDLVSHFARLLSEKSSGSAEQLQHLRSGLSKLDETSKDVGRQQATLRDNERRMAESSAKAQQMLDRIVAETDVTKKERDVAEALRSSLQGEQDGIDKDAYQMQVDLAEAEPALRSAENALSTVKPEYLREIRAYTTPPIMVKRVLEATCALLGEKNSDSWDVLKSYIKRDDFLATVCAFKPDHVTQVAKERVLGMMRDPKFSVELAYRASKAAGPLLQWVFAQVQFSDIYKRVAPIRDKIMKLIRARESKVKALAITEKDIQVKEESLNKLKSEYQVTTQEINDLKNKTLTVSSKCERATTILNQLIGENQRWREEIKNFDLEARTTLGDCIVSAAFLSYIGYYDEFTRHDILVPRWSEYLAVSAIPVRAHLSVVDFLVPPTMRLRWEEKSLPKDRLCLENATIMDRCQRYTLLVDPSGTASRFLQSFYADKKIAKASFSRPGYLKQLELAVRFGYPILLEDAELLDPAVAPLLNHEIRRTGGHLITRIGANDVDMSPTFKLFLLTRDPHYQPAPDLAGQVCVVNFTVTLSSMQSQCLHQVLLRERPDTDKRRTELLSVQGEYRLRLRVLEQNLLTSIAESTGSLLENDALISSLAKLKTEASRIEADITTSEASMGVIALVESHYRPVATAAARIFFALERFSELSGFYRYDVELLFRVLQDALSALPPHPHATGSDHNTTTATAAAAAATATSPNSASRLLLAGDEGVERSRAHLLVNHVFTLAYRRVVRGMFKEDHLVLALRLAQLRSSVRFSDDSNDDDDNNGSGRVSLGVSMMRGGSAPRSMAATPRSVLESEWDWLIDSLSLAPGAAAASAASGNTTTATDLSASVRRAGSPDAAAGSGGAAASGVATVSLPTVLLKKGVLVVGRQGRAALYALLDKPAFREVRQSLTTQSAAWEAYLHSATPEDGILSLPAVCFPADATNVRRLFLVTLVLFFTRRDSFTAAVGRLLALFFDGEEADGSPTASSPVSGGGRGGGRSVFPTVDSNDTDNSSVTGRSAFGKFFASSTHNIRDILPELTATTPLLLIVDSTYDPSPRVEQAAREAKATLRVVAMGSAESTEFADDFIDEGIRGGSWVLMKNIHLAREYLSRVEKMLHFAQLEGNNNRNIGGGVHANFRLMLTVERGAKEDPRDGGESPNKKVSAVPINLLSAAAKMVFESPPGLKSSLMQTYGSLDARRLEAECSANNIANRSRRQSSISPSSAALSGSLTTSSSSLDVYSSPLERVYLATAWLHSVIVERLSYVPLGWTQAYEFSDTEFLRAAQAVVAWTEQQQRGGSTTTTTTSVASAPVMSWPALRRIISTTVYGGKVSNPFDEHLFDIFSQHILKPQIYDKSSSSSRGNVLLQPPASLAKYVTSLPPPLPDSNNTTGGDTRRAMLKWIDDLPDGSSNPQWLGLPSGVARMLRARQGLETVERLTAVQIVMNEELATSGSGGGGVGGRLSNSVSAATSTRRDSNNTSQQQISGGASMSLLAPGSLDRMGVTNARWAEKVRGYCLAWGPALRTVLGQLEKHAFVAKALAAADVARSTGLISGVDDVLEKSRATGSRESSLRRGSTTASGVVGGGGVSKSAAAAAAAAVIAPLELAVQRESVSLVSLLRLLCSDIAELAEVCDSARKPSSAHRQLMEELTKDRVPLAWSGFLYTNTTTHTAAALLAPSWVADIELRAAHLVTLADATFARRLPNTCVTLGLLCFPGAFLTAAKQQYARELRAPLELLSPSLEVMTEAQLKSRALATASTSSSSSSSSSAGTLHLSGVTLFSAQVGDGGKCELIHATTAVAELSAPIAVRWSWKVDRSSSSSASPSSSSPAGGNAGSGAAAVTLNAKLAAQRQSQGHAKFPFYVTEQRDALLDVVELPVAATGDLDTWYQRGVCLAAWVPRE